MNADASRSLDYAPAPRRRRARRLLLVAAVISLVVSAGAMIVNHFRDQISYWWFLTSLRHSALYHTASPADVIVKLDPTDTQVSWNKIRSHYFTCDTFWQDWLQRLDPNASQDSNFTVFLHEVDTPSGHPCVMEVEVLPMWAHDGPVLTLSFHLFDCGTFFHPLFRQIPLSGASSLPVENPGFAASGLCARVAKLTWHSTFRLYAAYPRPTNASELVIPYTCDGLKGSFICRLDDGNAIEISSSDGRPLPIELPAVVTGQKDRN